jgi:ABC-type branched-subunit amino acid transport system substrate-binding protein/serine/threonine protein kinase
LRAVTNPSRPLSLYTAKSGDVLKQGRYRLVEQLTLPDNQQNQGAAWLAVDTASGMAQVVIREVIFPTHDPEEKRQQLRALALRLSGVAQHPGFPRVLDVFSDQTNAFIVLQHIEGESLASLLRRQGGALPERTVAEYGRQLCEMLVVLSQQPVPVVHGAISPETVIVAADRIRVHLVHLPFFPPVEVSDTGSAPGYKAPEQERGLADAATDLYAVAATLHHAVTGFDPRERIAFFYPPARRLNPAVSAQMEAILVEELHLSAPQRYANAAEMQKALEKLLSSSGGVGLDLKTPLPPVHDSWQLDTSEIRKRSQRRSVSQLSIFAAVSLILVLCAVFLLGIYPLLKAASSGIGHAALSPTANPTSTMMAEESALQSEWQTEATTYKTEQVAISDGRYAFDVYAGRPAQELVYKKEAAQAVLNDQLGAAFSDYEKALTLDPTDGEAQIYYEDLKIQTQGDTYVTIVLGLPLDSSPTDLSFTRADLQAAFVFQHEVDTNNLLPGGLKLRILVASSGAQDGNAGLIAQYIARRVQLGNLDHIVAVVGWPTDGGSNAAASALAAVQIPLISQSASGISLNGLSSYFFRVVPDDTTQGALDGQLAYQQMGARSALVLRDPSNASSTALASAFTASFQKLGGVVVDNPADYFTERTTTYQQYEQAAIRDAMNNHVDLIFMPGTDQDAVRLAYALGEMTNIFPYYLTKIKILGSNAIGTDLLIGKGTSAEAADAQLSSGDPLYMERLRFTAFSDVSEWDNVAPSQQPAFFTEWQQLYGATATGGPAMTSDALMTNDAFGVIVYALKQVRGALTGENVRDALVTIGTDGAPSYQGISGPISFASDGNPVNKPVALMEVTYDPQTNANVIQLVQTSGNIQVSH